MEAQPEREIFGSNEMFAALESGDADSAHDPKNTLQALNVASSSSGSSSSEEEAPPTRTCAQSAWSPVSASAFIVGNLMFAGYCWQVIPMLQGKNSVVVYSIAAYISILGIAQCLERFATGSGTNYGKFGGDASSEVKSTYAKIMDGVAAPTVPISISWWTMEQPSFIVPAIFMCLFLMMNKHISAGCVYLGMFMIHYFQRSFVYPILTRGKPYPALYWFLALVFTSCNGTLQSLELLYSGRYEDTAELYSPLAIIGYVVFAFGMYTNIRCDYILRNLRAPGDTGYKIPEGFMFEYISGANLWGEVIEWTGFAIATRGLGATVFAVFCWIGIGSRCIATHTWYLKKFGDEYPKGRKHLIPFVW